MYVCVALVLVALVGRLFDLHRTSRATDSSVVAVELGAVPDPKLTPGRTRTVAIREICSMPREEIVREVPPPLREKILQEYGIKNARAGDYEIDYLITPGLGGAEDIHNLWPEPYASSVWNAHTKDTLEEHLHELVCAGKLDLSTAQRDIATDWIGAYKRYFHTERPLSKSSDLVTTSDERDVMPGRFVIATISNRSNRRRSS